MTVSQPHRSTLTDVAKLAGVHVGTASRALDPANENRVNAVTRERVRAAADTLGYRVNAVARGLRKGASGLLGVVVADVANPFLPPLLRGIEEGVRAEGMSLLIAETHDEPGSLEGILDNLVSRRVDAIVVSAGRAADASVVRDFSAIVPVVLAVRSLGDGLVLPAVVHDDAMGAHLAVDHLHALGHRLVAELPGPADISSFAGRTQGFRDAVRRNGMQDVSDRSAIAGVPTVDEGHRLASALLDGPVGRRPTAVFAHNDLMAVGCLEAMRERGLDCPRDLSVVGYNDAPLSAHLRPALTTVRLPSRELGLHAAALALAVLEEGAPDGEPVLLPPELVVRDSTAPVKH
ncbi:transcriptional regulator, LacI family [Klenkia soli]|uniref:Transcriptional regulator, LacI family n=1 Tax=Klenkia soli TaxID=1052260 RepID=A0A1H0G257_9ACTN|nr:LacI family DNA-binding transcriptional regulator [Klenkia soli]SDO00940.1 transcriptional regulator, LacI family [Klenkia soli]